MDGEQLQKENPAPSAAVILPTLVDLEEILKAALESLHVTDSHLLKEDANERSISHRLGLYLQLLMPLWHVDCEYNRHGQEPKRTIVESREKRTDDDTGDTVYPDINIHRRGPRGPNLLIIEVKKSTTSDQERDEAIRKLKSYRGVPLYYQHAVLVVVPVGNSNADSCLIKWF